MSEENILPQCPFRVEYPRKYPEKHVFLTGKFNDPNKTLDRQYFITSKDKWDNMQVYNSFVVNGVKYYGGNYVFVDTSPTTEDQSSGHKAMPLNKLDHHRVARILEIRATDETASVYARICWMYRPEELPADTLDGKRYIQGRQSYHGRNELIATNDTEVDIIEVDKRVTGEAEVFRYDEQSKDKSQSALYWRQALELDTRELSSRDLDNINWRSNKV